MTDPEYSHGRDSVGAGAQLDSGDQANLDETVTDAQSSTGDRLYPSGADVSRPDTDDDEDLPETFGRYRIGKRLGRGAMGAVYWAHDTQLNRPVALKVPQFRGQNSQQLIARFYQEARSAATLSHPNICPVHDVGQIGGTHFISMGYVDGRPLSEELAAGRKLSEEEIATLVRQLARGLEEAHQKGVIHRDLKPSNIMINQRDEPIIMDFGLALQLSDGTEARLTQNGVVIGSPAYMAPEQVEGRRDLGPATDVYGLGVVLYEMLTGSTPFQGSAVNVIGQILHSEPTPVRELQPDVSAELAAVCQRAMAKKTEDRFASMAEFAEALSAVLEDRPASQSNDFLWSGGSQDVPTGQTRTLSAESGTDAGPVATQQTQKQSTPRWLMLSVVVSVTVSLLAVLCVGFFAFQQTRRDVPQNRNVHRKSMRKSPGGPLGGLHPQVVNEMTPREVFDRLDRDGNDRLAGREVPPHVIHRVDANNDREIAPGELADGLEDFGPRLFDPPQGPHKSGQKPSRPRR